MERVPMMRWASLLLLPLVACATAAPTPDASSTREPTSIVIGAAGAGTFWQYDAGTVQVGNTLNITGAGASLTGGSGVATLNVPGGGGTVRLVGDVDAGPCPDDGAACSSVVYGATPLAGGGDQCVGVNNAGTFNAASCTSALSSSIGGLGATQCVAGQQWLLPCASPRDSTTCNVGAAYSHAQTCVGDTSMTYAVTLRFRGVVEYKSITGGSSDGAQWNVDGTPAVDGANLYKLTVSNPSHIYYLNAGSESAAIHAIDYTKTITVAGGATVTLSADPVDAIQYLNAASTGGPLSVTGISSPAQPYNGQFMQVDSLIGGTPGAVSSVTGALTVPYGGTGDVTLAAHAHLLGEGTSAVATVGPCATGQPQIGQGASADPVCGTVAAAYQAAQSMGGTSAGLTFGGTTAAVTLSGQQSIAGGGTGQSTRTSAFNGLAPASSAQGDVLYNNGTDWVRLAAGTSGQFLQTAGSSANPAWASCPGLTPSYANVATDESTSTTSYTDLATPGPAVTVTVGSSKKLLITFGALIYSTVSNAFDGRMTFAISGANTLAAADGNEIRVGVFSSAYIPTYSSVSRTMIVTVSSTGSTTVTGKYRALNATAAYHFLNRDLTVTPLSVFPAFIATALRVVEYAAWLFGHHANDTMAEET